MHWELSRARGQGLTPQRKTQKSPRICGLSNTGPKSAQRRRSCIYGVRLVEFLKERVHCFIESSWIVIRDEMIALNQNQFRIG